MGDANEDMATLSDHAVTSARRGTPLQITIGADQYLALPYDGFRALSISSHHPRPTLFTAILVENARVIDREYLEKIVSEYDSKDDVFRKECLQGILFVSPEQQKPTISEDVAALLTKWQNAWTDFALTGDGKVLPRPGPYYMDERGAYQLYKIQDDNNHAFVVSAIPSLTESEGWEPAYVSGKSFSCLGVPTPSRLYFEASKDRPLDGLRIAVKDIYHMKGLRTSVCNRAFHDMYPPQNETAPSLQRLVDCGAQLCGKTHLSSFAWREEPTECTDYQAPFNPRADGYQSPAGSSSGSGAAIASYDWLDFTIGTDTTGSGRRPALWNGSFALRPSAGLLPTTGMIPTCPPFDVPSFFGRDIGTFKNLILSWYGRDLQPEASHDAPYAIILPTDFVDIENLEQRRLIDEFAADLGKHLGADVMSLSISEEWAATSPVSETDLEVYMYDVQEHGFYYDAFHCFDDFLAKYKDKFGTTPYLSPPTQRMWDIGQLISQEQRDNAMERFKIFRGWFLEHIMRTSQRNTLVLLPIESLEPRYRDDPPAPPIRLPRGISVLFLSPTLGSPEIVVPIGHYPYKSRVTSQVEYLPVAVAILAAPDMDARLVDLVQDFLQSTKRHTKVKVGPNMF